MNQNRMDAANARAVTEGRQKALAKLKELRLVGRLLWWCPVCDREHRPDVVSVDCPPAIPRFLPIPEGQRPLVEDEVETGGAEVATSYSSPSPSTPFTVVRGGNRVDTVLDGMDLGATIQRIVTGATE